MSQPPFHPSLLAHQDYYLKQRGNFLAAQKLIFSDVVDKDVYNITAPFHWQGEEYLAARVESADKEHDSETRFFRHTPDGWRFDPTTVTLSLQDPFVTIIQEELIIGGVAVEWDASGQAKGWATEFWRGPNLKQLALFARGPQWMKDIRLVELPRGEIGVFTRPVLTQPIERKPIGFTCLPSLDALTANALAQAPILEGQFANGVWGGVNEAHLLPNGLIGVLGHVAWFDDNRHRHYWAMTFELNPATRQYTPLKLLAGRNDFPDGRAKRPDLSNVIFSGGLKRHDNGRATLYAGLGDAEAGQIDLPDPFIGSEVTTWPEATSSQLQPAAL